MRVDPRNMMDAEVRGLTPSPDAFERIESKVRRRELRRRWASGLVVLVLLAGSGLLVWRGFGPLLGPGEETSTSKPGSGSPAPPSPSNQSPFGFPPHTYEEAPGSIAMPLTFPNGDRVEVVAPSDVPLGSLQVRSSTTGDVGTAQVGSGCCARDLQVYYAAPEAIPVLGDRVVRVFEGSPGSVELWEGDATAGAELYLVFRFGSWTVLVYDTADGMSHAQRSSWAENLTGHVTSDGFLVLEAAPPLYLEGPGYPSGPQVQLVGPDFRPDVALNLTACEPDAPAEVRIEEVSGAWYATWCPPGGIVKVQASGPRGFVEALVDGLKVR